MKRHYKRKPSGWWRDTGDHERRTYEGEYQQEVESGRFFWLTRGQWLAALVGGILIHLTGVLR